MLGMFNEALQPHGEWRSWFPDGRLREQRTYVNGQLDGLEAVWYKNGTQRYVSKRKDCLQHGSYKKWAKDGTLLLHRRYKDGMKHGCWQSWDPSGQQLRLENWKEGKKHGVFKREGNLENYKDGLLHGEVQWTIGWNKHHGAFENGKKQGVWKRSPIHHGQAKTSYYDQGRERKETKGKDKNQKKK